MVKRTLLVITGLVLAATTLAGCGTDGGLVFQRLPAQTVAWNLSYRTDHFEAYRRITVRNEHTNEITDQIEGWCAYWLRSDPDAMLIVCIDEPGGDVANGQRHWFDLEGATYSVVMLNSLAVSTARRER